MGPKRNHARRRPLRLLIADDCEPVAKLLGESCSSIPGIELIGLAHDGAEALQIVRQERPDVAVLDLRMPKFSGLEVLKLIRAEGLADTVIIFTGLPAEPYRQICLEAGADCFFEKATDIRQLLETLKKLTRHRPKRQNRPDASAE